MSTLEFSQLLGNYGEFVGAIAIVVTLIYLAMQLRQNTRAIQSSERAYRSNLEVATNGRFFDIRRDIYSNPELRSIWIRGLLDPNLLKHDEWYSFSQYFWSFMLSIGEQFRIEPDLLWTGERFIQLCSKICLDIRALVGPGLELAMTKNLRPT